MADSDQPTSIRLPPALKLYLMREAKQRRYKVSMLIVYILEQWKKYQQEKPK